MYASSSIIKGYPLPKNKKIKTIKACKFSLLLQHCQVADSSLLVVDIHALDPKCRVGIINLKLGVGKYGIISVEETKLNRF